MSTFTGTIGAALASAAIVVIAFAVTIAVIEEIRIALGEREVRKVQARVARARALEAARGRHPSAIMRDDIEAAVRYELNVAKARYRADENQP